MNLSWDEYDDGQAALWWDERQAFLDRHPFEELPDRLKTERELELERMVDDGED